VNGWIIRDPWIFFGIAGALVGYVLYMMVRKRKGERSPAGRELDL
jgi:hypothetical protein